MTLLIALLLALVCAGLAGSITRDRGRGAGIGIALGLLLSVIGVVIALLLPRRDTALAGPQLYRECPHCREPVRRDASVCPHCRRDVDAWQLIDGRWWHEGSQGWHWLDENVARWIPGTPATEAPAVAGVRAVAPAPPGATAQGAGDPAADAAVLAPVDGASADDAPLLRWRRRHIFTGVAGLLALTAVVVGLAVSAGGSSDGGGTPAVAAEKPAQAAAAPTRYGQLLPHGLTARAAAAPACASYRAAIGRWQQTAAAHSSALAAVPGGDAYAAADFADRTTNHWVYANTRPRFAHDLRLVARKRLAAATGGRARLITASMLDRFQADSLFACKLGTDARRMEQQLTKLDTRADAVVALAAAKPWFPQGWNTAPGDAGIAVRWDNEIGKCQGDSYGYCWGLRVMTRDGCPNGLYAEINILSNGTVVDYSNDTTGSLSPGDQAELAFHSFEDGYGQLQGHLKEVNCY